MPVNTRRTAQDLLHPGDDPEKIVGRNRVAPNTAAMTKEVGDVRLTGREKNRLELFQAWPRL